MRAARESIPSFPCRLARCLSTVFVLIANPWAISRFVCPCPSSINTSRSRLVSEPREILKRLPGIKYEELPEADWCCGGAGSYAVAHHELSRKVLDRKIENLKKTGADILVTSCPACIIQLSYGVRRHGLNTRVCHLSELVNGLEGYDG